MKKLKGKSVMLRADNKTITCATSCSLSVTTQFEESKTKDDAEGPNNEPTWVDWTMSSENMVGVDEKEPVQLTYEKLLDLQLEKTAVELSMDLMLDAGGAMPEGGWQKNAAAPKGWASYGGKAYIESVQLNAPNDGKATLSVNFKPAGPLAKITA